mmetsp:Transcript_59053/g.63738  ORF Transcript_59053/g.63738 Transcript_59053/m.63738 type:complete len:96 (+) Transcript_59053:91-378(+)
MGADAEAATTDVVGVSTVLRSATGAFLWVSFLPGCAILYTVHLTTLYHWLALSIMTHRRHNNGVVVVVRIRRKSSSSSSSSRSSSSSCCCHYSWY